MKRTLIAVLIAMLAGCGGSGGTSPVQQTGIPDPVAIAKQIGATQIGAPYTGKLGASWYIDARLNGRKIVVAVFADRTLESDWVSIAGLAGAIIRQGNDYAVLQPVSSTPSPAPTLTRTVAPVQPAGRAPETPCSLVNNGFLVIGDPGGNSTPEGECEVAFYGNSGNGSIRLTDSSGLVTWYDLGVPSASG
jgi:hypothetical protein